MTPEPDEYELARRARDGDREALSELVERSRLRLFALAYAELRHYEDAQDVVAAALLRICRHVGELREPERARAWMQSVVRNEARRRLRCRAGEAVSLEEIEREPSTDAGPSLLRLDIELALRRLPRDQAKALSLFYLARLPIEEIASQTGRPEGTIKRWLHLGRRRLATEMEEYAPMAATPTPVPPPLRLSAAIISDEFDPALLNDEREAAAPRSRRQLVEALEAAGFVDVTIFDDVEHLVNTQGSGIVTDWQLAEPLKGKQLILLDESVSGMSAFEILAILKLVPELQGTMYMMLASPPCPDARVFAAWCTGVECYLTKPLNIAELTGFGEHCREKLEQPAPP